MNKTLEGYLLELDSRLQAGQTSEVLDLYDHTFHKMQAHSLIKPPVDTRDIQLHRPTRLLYSEFYYRDLAGRQGLDLQARVQQWENYLQIIEEVLKPGQIQLPSQLLWDVLEGFVNQFEEFWLRYEEDQELREQKINDVGDVLRQLDEMEAGALQNGRVRSDIADHQLKVLGLFAFVNKIRVLVQIGEIQQVYGQLQKIDEQTLEAIATFPTCFITLNSYAAFISLLGGRIYDATQCLERACEYFYKIQKYYSKSFSYKRLTSVSDRNLALLGLINYLYPIRLNRNLRNTLMKKWGSAFSDATTSDHPIFEEIYQLAKPAFISPGNGHNSSLNENFLINYKRIISENIQIQRLWNVCMIYKKIPLSTLARHLKITKEEVEQLLQKWRELHNQLVFVDGFSRSEENSKYLEAELAKGENQQSESLVFSRKSAEQQLEWINALVVEGENLHFNYARGGQDGFSFYTGMLTSLRSLLAKQ